MADQLIYSVFMCLQFEMLGAEAAQFLSGPAVEEELSRLDAADALLTLSEAPAPSPPPPYQHPPGAEALPSPPRAWLELPPPALLSPLQATPPAPLDAAARRLVGDVSVHAVRVR